MILLAATESIDEMMITIVAAIAAGVALLVIARTTGIPAIVMLLAGGFLLGPSVAGVVRPDSLGEDGLRVLVAMAVGLILFEGGLTLDITGYRAAPRMIKRLLSVGVGITWLGAAALIHFIVDLPWGQSFVAGSLVIVTGPTVIAPLLKRIRIHLRLHSILHWEGVLIDPIGVLIAVLCYEFVSGSDQTAALANFAIRVVAGLGIGAAGGSLLGVAVRRKLIPEDMVNIVALASAVLIFGLAEVILEESGLLAVTAAGFLFGVLGSGRLKQVRIFKAELTDLLIGTLFILLAARLDPDQFRDFGADGVFVVVVLMLLRPLSIFVCSLGTDLTIKEKAFLGWVAPRGIVAASMASLFALRMDQKFVETFTYSVIIATIVLQGSTAGWLAGRLGLRRPKPTGWMLAGAHPFARRIARFLAEAGEREVLLVDTNARAVQEAINEGLSAVSVDARDTALQDRPDFQSIGNVLALTDNEDLNARICSSWREAVGSDHVFRCSTTSVEHARDDDEAGRLLWSRLPRPSLLSGELLRGEALMLHSAQPRPVFLHLAQPLAWVSEGVLTLDPDVGTDKPPDGATVLYLQREADYLLRSLQPEFIVDLEAQDLQSVLDMLMERIVEYVPALADDETVGQLVRRETVYPTAIGNGVAVPHGYVDGLEARLCAVARLTQPLDLAAPDAEGVRLVFLLLSPAGDPEGHLATLAEIARLVHGQATRTRLLEAQSPLEFMGIVRSAQTH